MGAGDNLSGTTVLLEAARGLGTIYKNGWRSKRSIILCSWDAEEYGLIGSTEFVEKHFPALQARAVAYVNLDLAVSGSEVFYATGTPNLLNFLKDAAKSIATPTDSSKKVFDMWIKKDNSLYFPPLAAGSDYKAFLQQIGISCIDFAFENVSGAYGGVYHSNYDSFTWMKKFGDKDFVWHATASKLLGIMLMRLAEAKVLPLNYVDYANEINKYILALEKLLKDLNITSDKYDLSFTRLKDSTSAFLSVATNIEEFKAKVLDPTTLRSLNNRLMLLERSFIDPRGVLNQLDVRHIVYAPNPYNSYGGQAFASLEDAIRKRDPKAISFQIGYISVFIQKASEYLKGDL